MLADGITVDDMIKKACSFYCRMNGMFGEQANVEPVSQLYVPDRSDGDHIYKTVPAHFERRGIERDT